MRLTKKQLRDIIKEEAENLDERGMGMNFGLDDTVNNKGSERKIQAGESPTWKKLKANANMAATHIQKLQDSILDQDEAAAAHHLEAIQKFAKLGYDAILGN